MIQYILEMYKMKKNKDMVILKKEMKNYIWVIIYIYRFMKLGFWKDDKYDGFGYLKNKNIDYGNINIQNLNSV